MSMRLSPRLIRELPASGPPASGSLVSVPLTPRLIREPPASGLLCRLTGWPVVILCCTILIFSYMVNSLFCKPTRLPGHIASDCGILLHRFFSRDSVTIRRPRQGRNLPPQNFTSDAMVFNFIKKSAMRDFVKCFSKVQVNDIGTVTTVQTSCDITLHYITNRYR